MDSGCRAIPGGRKREAEEHRDNTSVQTREPKDSLMKLHEITKANRRISNDEGGAHMTNDEGWNSLRSEIIFLKQTEYIIRYSLFNINMKA